MAARRLPQRETGPGARQASAARRPSRALVVRELGETDYAETWQRMRAFTDQRGARSDDELWLTEHPPVYTLGQAGRREHLIDPGSIPVVQSDRGGQVTYHGPGQLIAYALLDLRRAGLGVRSLVDSLEQSVIELLVGQRLSARRRRRAPGVYVAEKKICALGLRVRHGCCYHGLALNVDMDLAPFAGIDPCGYAGLEVTQLAELGVSWSVAQAGRRLAAQMAKHLGYRLVQSESMTTPRS